MKEILNEIDFLDCLDSYLETYEEVQDIHYETTHFRGTQTEDSLFVTISDKTFENLYLRDVDFMSIRFKNCVFKNVDFTNSVFNISQLDDCNFYRCRFNDVKFIESDILNTIFELSMWAWVDFSDSLIENTHVKHSPELLELMFGGCEISDLHFFDGNISHSRFEPLREYNVKNYQILFEKMEVNNSLFFNIDFRKSQFDCCSFDQSTFSNCTLLNSTFTETNFSNESNFCSIDLQTIDNSEPQKPIVLRNVFGIHNEEIQDFISGFIQEIKYQTIFISYSFKDKEFANTLNQKLKAKGVFTFLYEKDAPGGKRIRKIMMDGVAKHDRLLFIASKNSITSEACQFELSQGRIKQEENWETIYFPIHIDNYLFEVSKDVIRPKSKRDEYWENITELKDVHSLDFSKFNRASFDSLDFDRAVKDLINELRK